MTYATPATGEGSCALLHNRADQTRVSMTVSLPVACVAGVRRGNTSNKARRGLTAFPQVRPRLRVELRGFEPLTFSLRESRLLVSPNLGEIRRNLL